MPARSIASSPIKSVPRRPTVWPLATAAVAVALLIGTIVTLAWVGGDPSPRPRELPAGLVERLCAAAGAAGANNRTEARRFFDTTGRQRDRLTERVAARDQAAAARLVEAADEVEANLAAPRPALEEGLLTLVAATRAALEVVGDPVPPPCPPDEDR